MKKRISLFLALVLVCGCLSMGVSAADVPFSDVPADAYYAEAVAWAVENGVTAGVTADRFGPDEPCTRAQVMTMIWRGGDSPAPETSESPFSDVTPDKYFYDAVLSSMDYGITAGVGDGKFGAEQPCTRAQIMTFLWRACDSMEADISSVTFTDVPADAYYAEAVAWAVKYGITSGVGNNLFGSDSVCTRAQVVTFLWKVCEG